MKFALPIIALLGLSLSALHVSAQCDTSGQAAYINNTVDLNRFSGCTTLPGIVFGFGTLMGDVSLPSLTTISRQSDGFGIVIQGSNITNLNLPALTSFDGNQFRFIDNVNLQSLSASQLISVQTPPSGGGVEIVFQNNPRLSSVSLGFNNLFVGPITVGGGSAQGLDGLIGSLNFPNLAATSGDIRVTNNGLNSASNASTQLNLNFPVLTQANSLILVNNTLNSINIPSAFTTTDGLTVTGNKFTSSSNAFVVNYVSLPNILFSNNVVAGSVTYALNLDNVNSLASDVTVSNNAGLNVISFRNLQYVDGAFTISGNQALASFSQPRGLIMNNNGLVFSSNGGSAPQRLTALIGVQNATQVLITGNSFLDVVLPQLRFIGNGGAFEITDNIIAGRLVANSTFGVDGTATISRNNQAAASVFDLSGLATVGGNLNIENNLGASASLLLSQLYVVIVSVSITGNNGFNTLSFGNLGFIGTLSASNQNTLGYVASSTANPGGLNQLNIVSNTGLTTIQTASATTSAWSTTVLTIDSNSQLTTVTLNGLVQVGYLTITNNNAVTSIAAPQLSCLGAATIASGALTTVNLGSLKSSNKFQISNSDPNCQAQLGTISAECSQQCYACAGTNPCNGANAATKTAQCGQNGNPFAAAAGCSTVNFAAYTTTGATLSDSTIPDNGGTGNNPSATRTTSTVVANPATTTVPTRTNSNAFTTTVSVSATTGSGTGTTRPVNTGSSSILSASFMLLASIVAFFM